MTSECQRWKQIVILRQSQVKKLSLNLLYVYEYTNNEVKNTGKSLVQLRMHVGIYAAECEPNLT